MSRKDELPAETPTVEWHADQLWECLDSMQTHWVEFCKRLAQAKKDLKDTEFDVLTEHHLGLSPATVSKYLKIAMDSRVLSNWKSLPPSWTTAYELTKLDDQTFATAIETREIHPGMDGSDAKSLVQATKNVPKSIKDSMKQPVPVKMINVFQAGHILTTAERKVTKVIDDVTDAAEILGIDLVVHLKRLNDFCTRIHNDIPHAVCTCKGKGCDDCGGKGWVTSKEAKKVYF